MIFAGHVLSHLPNTVVETDGILALHILVVKALYSVISVILVVKAFVFFNGPLYIIRNNKEFDHCDRIQMTKNQLFFLNQYTIIDLIKFGAF